ncbi:MAG: DUF6529 family protein [Acidimicrobiales bacterium]
MVSEAKTISAAEQSEANTWLVASLLTGAVVALLLGVYSKFHDGTFDSVALFFFSNQLRMKTWLALVAGLLAIFQIISAEIMYGRIKVKSFPKWIVPAHRLSGLLAVLFSLPVAYHCLWSIGFDFGSQSLRVWVHALAGLFFYGAFVTKVMVIRIKNLPGWAIPLVGGLLFLTLIVAVLTSVTVGFSREGFGI